MLVLSSLLSLFLMPVKTCCAMFFSVIRGYLILSIMFFQALFVGCMRKWNACSSRHFIPFCKTPTPTGIPCFETPCIFFLLILTEYSTSIMRKKNQCRSIHSVKPSTELYQNPTHTRLYYLV